MKQQITMVQVIFSFMITLIPALLIARDAPLTTAGSSTICPGNVTVPVTVTNFSSIKAISLRLDYNPTQISFVSFTNLNPTLAGASINNVPVNATLSKVMIAWTSIIALSLTNGSKLLDINFTMVSGSPVIAFNNTDNSGGDCEYADENGNAMNDIPTANFYFNSTITNLGAAAAGSINGPSILCAGTTNVTYTVPPIVNATGYVWTVPTGASVVSGGNSASIVVNYSNSAVSGNITVAGTNTCGTGTSSALPITINPRPVPVINGLTSVCLGASGISYTSDQGMTGYSWNVSAGGMITSGAGTNTITVNWNNPGTQTLSVNYINGNGCTASSATVITITVDPLTAAAGPISGTGNVCAGTNGVIYTTSVIPNATLYLWTLPPGATISSGQGTNTVTVNFGPTAVSGYVTVSGSNPCGVGLPSSLPVMVNPLPADPGIITGPANICPGTAGVIYSVPAIPNAMGYIWTIPPGAQITSGAATNQITVTFGPVPLSGQITVCGSNICGNGPISPDFNITIGPIPPPVVTAAGPVLTSNFPAGNQWYYEETGAIPGATGQAYTAVKTGWYWASVNIYGCNSDTSNHVYVLFEGQPDIFNTASVLLYPDPNDGRFTILITDTERDSCIIRIYNQAGSEIMNIHEDILNGSLKKNIDLNPACPGIYTVVILHGTQKTIKKVLVTR